MRWSVPRTALPPATQCEGATRVRARAAHRHQQVKVGNLQPVDDALGQGHLGALGPKFFMYILQRR